MERMFSPGPSHPGKVSSVSVPMSLPCHSPASGAAFSTGTKCSGTAKPALEVNRLGRVLSTALSSSVCFDSPSLPCPQLLQQSLSDFLPKHKGRPHPSDHFPATWETIKLLHLHQTGPSVGQMFLFSILCPLLFAWRCTEVSVGVLL